jgi:hypothetical protein
MAFFGPKGPDVTKVEKLEDGEESVRAGGKKYKCQWVRVRVTEKTSGGKSTSDLKMWRCKDVPLYGVVKIEWSQQGFAMVFEIRSLGSK